MMIRSTNAFHQYSKMKDYLQTFKRWGTFYHFIFVWQKYKETKDSFTKLKFDDESMNWLDYP